MPKNEEFQKNGDSSSLVVLVHGYDKDPARLADIKKEINTQLPNADLLWPAYEEGNNSNSNPLEISGNIEALIDDTYNEKLTKGGPYKKIILVGYSIGALLLRKAYVHGLGIKENYLSRSPAHDWTRHVERIILIAGMNRGWSLEERPEDMNAIKFHFYRALLPLFRVLPFWKFLKSFERGTPFVANLRLQWVRFIRETPEQAAPVLQLLGSVDDLVTARDDTDLYIHRDFIFMPVQGAGHNSLIQFDDTAIGRRSKTRFVEALIEPIPDIKTKYQEEQRVRQELIDTSEKHIIFVLHGIRDYGGWTGDIRDELERVSTNLGLPPPKVVTAKYDFFSMIRFLLLPARQHHVRWFMDEYTEQIATYPNSNSQVSFIGHSNGTYILASALKKYTTMRIHRVSFAGSVVNREYPWEQIITEEGRVEKLRNDLAASDWVVALFPKLFDQLNWSDIGSGGFDGFNDNAANAYEGRYYKGGHSAAIAPGNRESIAMFILTGEIKRNPELMTDSQPGWLQLVSKGSGFVWLLLIGMIVLPSLLLYHIDASPLLQAIYLLIVYYVISLF
jgi:predicted esterase